MFLIGRRSKVLSVPVPGDFLGDLPDDLLTDRL